VSEYLEVRTAIHVMEDAHKEELAALKEKFEAIASRLLDVCNENNADSIKTASGTVSRRISERYWSSDWGSMREFIIEHQAPELLEQRIHNGNMKQFLEENPDLLPAGLQNDRKYVVQVRKPNAK
jgi:hypothetical protein